MSWSYGQYVGIATMDVRPDMLTCAKALSSAYLPISAIMLSEKIYVPIAEHAERLESGHGFTYSAHPVCAAVALRAQELMQERDIICHVQAISPQFKVRTVRLSKFDFIGNERAVGLIVNRIAVNSDDHKKFDPRIKSRDRQCPLSKNMV